jgi:hypothetical protein
MIAQPAPSIATLHDVARLANLAALAVLAVGVFQAWRDRSSSPSGVDPPVA